MYRYVGMIWDPQSAEALRTVQSVRAAVTPDPAGWLTAYEGPGAWVIHTGSRQGSVGAYLLRNNGGVVLGKLFDRRTWDYQTSPVISFDETETQRIIESAGQRVIDCYWGSYVAFLHDGSACTYHVLRDPVGTLPCYHTSQQGVELFFCDIEDCVHLLPVSFSINRRLLTRWLVAGALAIGETGLEDVDEPLIGECLTIYKGTVTRRRLWDPVEIARTPRFEHPTEAARELRSTVLNTVNAWASCYQRITHRLSGGLDSSIVAACLAQAPSRPWITFLNYSPDVNLDSEPLRLPGLDERTADRIRALAGTGDERYFARLVAARWKLPLIEDRGIGSPDLARLWHAPLKPVPVIYLGGMHTDDVQIGLVRSHGIQAFFSGNAGDSVFLATSQPLSAIDYAFLHGTRGDFWQHLIAACDLSKETLWAVLLKATRHGILRSPQTRGGMSFSGKQTLLKQELAQYFTGEDFKVPIGLRNSRPRLPPGKCNHASGLSASAYHHGIFHSGRYADHIDPLNSQPIWETLLQIPTYTVLAGGISRGLARRAFADMLPAEIRKRQVKGTGSPLLQRILRTNKSLWREHLQEGLLAQEGYLDRQKLANCLAAEEPFSVIDCHHIAKCLTAEIWLRQWRNVRQGRQHRGDKPLRL